MIIPLRGTRADEDMDSVSFSLSRVYLTQSEENFKSRMLNAVVVRTFFSLKYPFQVFTLFLHVFPDAGQTTVEPFAVKGPSKPANTKSRIGVASPRGLAMAALGQFICHIDILTFQLRFARLIPEFILDIVPGIRYNDF